MVRPEGVEPPTSWSEATRSVQLSYGRFEDIILQMSDIAAQIESVEKEIRETPYHKGTEHHIGKLRAKLARLRDRAGEQESRRGGGKGGGYAVRKQGDATVVLVGPPSAGKSTLLNALTNATSRIAPYAFTTVTVIPGMMEYKNAKIQILDVPGLIEGAEEGKGRGREVLSVVRAADLIIIMSDVSRPEALDRIAGILEKNGIRLNKKPPIVRTEKKLSGGIIVHSNVAQELGRQTIKEVATEMGIKNAEIFINERLDLERLIDAFARNRVYPPAVYVINKVDEAPRAHARDMGLDFDDSSHRSFLIGAEKGTGLEELKNEIWRRLGFIVIYLTRTGERPNHDSPMIVKREMTLSRIARQVGEEFAENKKRAKIWGSGAKFPGQEVSLSLPAKEGMMVRFV